MSPRYLSAFIFLCLCATLRMAIAQEFGLDSRPANLSCHVHDRPVGDTAVAVELLTFLDDDGLSKPPLAMVQIPGDPSRWFVLSRLGKVTEYLEDDDFTRVGTFLDITDRVTTTFFGQSAEFGALSMAFHPDFAENGELFLWYTTPGEPHRARLSRFLSHDNGVSADPQSEQVILSLDLTSHLHVGGQIAFGDDGYLYIGTGDGGVIETAQDLDSLKGKMLRIDLDGGTPYAIPPDNPWADGGGRGEIYALGFRNPWRWTADMVTGEIWLGDVGGSQLEEVDLVVAGGNYGWPIKEGTKCFNAMTCDSEGLIDPVVEYPHNGGSAAVVGGFVYRGQNIPSLYGVYLYMDQTSGRIWGLFYEEDGQPAPELLLELGTAFSFAQGNDGELAVLQYNGPKRIVAQGEPPADPFPLTLSDSGCFDPEDLSQPADGLIPYDVNVELWSDTAVKQRWIALPDAATITIDTDGDWTFPIGTVLIKSFRLSGQLAETRLMMRHLDGEWAGYSYEWNDAQTEAYLLPAGKTKTIGGLEWSYPSRGRCLQCHTQVAKVALGPETAQLNGLLVYPSTGIEANQLETLAHIGMFDAPLPDIVGNLPRLPDLLDEAQPIDQRARAYLHANCAMCHQPGGTGLGPQNFHYSVAGENMGILDVLPTQGDFGIANARLLSAGHPESSIISYRINTLETGRMPPLGTRIVDNLGTEIVDRWIASGLGFGIPDSDNDLFADNVDNCTLAVNALQRDTDGDNLGNACDPDVALPNDCVVDVQDLGALKASFFTVPGAANWNADADFDGDDVVNLRDLAIMKSLFFQAPGPSGLNNDCEP